MTVSRDIPAAHLNEDVLNEYRNMDLLASERRPVFSLDCLFLAETAVIIAMDAPPKLKREDIRRDATFYCSLVDRALQRSGATPSHTRNVFPAISGMYGCESEGSVIRYKFISNGQSDIRGSYRKDSDECLRMHPGQELLDKSSEVEVKPFWILIKWSGESNQAFLALEGSRKMVLGSTVPVLDCATIPWYHTELGFSTATSRLIEHTD